MTKFAFLFVLIVTSLCAKDIFFGVVPQQSPLVLSKKWIPIMKELSKKTGHNIIFKTEATIPLFEKALYSGKYDIAYMNPYHYIIAHKKIGFEAIVRADKMIQGIILASKGKKISDLQTTNNKYFLFPAPMAFAATLLVKYEMKKKFNIDTDKHFQVRYVNSHDSVYKGINRGIGSFGGGIIRTFNNLNDTELQDKVHVIYKTKKYPSHPIATNSGLPAGIEKDLKKAFKELSPSLLKKLNINKFIYTNGEEYNSVKNLAIELKIY